MRAAFRVAMLVIALIFVWKGVRAEDANDATAVIKHPRADDRW